MRKTGSQYAVIFEFNEVPIHHNHSFGVLQRFNDSALNFQLRIGERSGLGQETYLPPGEDHKPDGVLETYSFNSGVSLQSTS